MSRTLCKWQLETVTCSYAQLLDEYEFEISSLSAMHTILLVLVSDEMRNFILHIH